MKLEKILKTILNEAASAEFKQERGKLIVEYKRREYSFQEFLQIAKKDPDAANILGEMKKKLKVVDVKELPEKIKIHFGRANGKLDIMIKDGGQDKNGNDRKKIVQFDDDEFKGATY